MVIIKRLFDGFHENFLLKIALTKKRQTPVQSLTKDERIAMTERENRFSFSIRIF
jgi:hypothetical protein